MAASFDVFWPRLTTVQRAAQAVRDASLYAYLVAAVTSAIAVYAVVNGPLWGFDGWSLGDALFLLLIGWRISKFSLPWTLVAVAYWMLNLASKIAAPQTHLTPIGVVSVLVLLGFINGVRGIRAFRRLSTSPVLVQPEG